MPKRKSGWEEGGCVVHFLPPLSAQAQSIFVNSVEPVSTQRALMQLLDICSMSQQNIIRNNRQQTQQSVLLKFLLETLLKGLKVISKDPIRCSTALKKKKKIYKNMYKPNIMKLCSQWRAKSPEPKSSEQFCSQHTSIIMCFTASWLTSNSITHH